MSDAQTVLGCPTLALPAQIHRAAGTEPREPCNGMVSAPLKCLHGPEPQTWESINSFPTMNRGFWHLTGREIFSFPAILPLPSQQMLHTNLLAANWQRFPPSSLCQEKRLLQPVRATIWHRSAQLGTISHQWHVSLQAARHSRPPHWTRRAERLQGSAQHSLCSQKLKASPGLAISAAYLGA